MAEDLSEFERWFATILNAVEPDKRKAAVMKLGQAIRRANMQRIAQNVDPQGRPMEARKPRLDGRGKLRRQTGKMFKGLRKLRNWKIVADADGVEIRPASGAVDRVAAVSQFGEVDVVGRLRSGREIRYRYPVRGILGIGAEDERLAMEIAESLIRPDD
jgi:phage virion morphogenesis protein